MKKSGRFVNSLIKFNQINHTKTQRLPSTESIDELVQTNV